MIMLRYSNLQTPFVFFQRRYDLFQLIFDPLLLLVVPLSQQKYALFMSPLRFLRVRFQTTAYLFVEHLFRTSF